MDYYNEHLSDVDNQVNHPYYSSSQNTRENPAFQSHNLNQPISEASNQFEQHEMRAPTASQRDKRAEDMRRMEEILMAMPSRTLGRRLGRHAAALANSSSSPGTYSRYMQNRILTYQDVEVNDDANDPAMELYEEIAERNNGEVPNSEIRCLPVGMQMKRKIRCHANAEREVKKSKQVGRFQMWRYNMAISRERFREGFRKRIHSPRLWSYHLKQVEGNFGSGVSSYFVFLRGLFFLSIPSFILNFAFITLPQILNHPNRTNPNISFTGEELITGANWLDETIMYYGFYTNGTIQHGSSSAEYEMPLAYLLATAGYFFLCLLWLSKLTATSFRENYIDGQVSYSNFTGRTFCAWDYGITSRSVAALHQKIITTDLKEVLADKLRLDASRSSSEICKLFFLRFFIWCVYFLVTGGLMTLIYYVNQKFLREIQEAIEDVAVLPQIALALIVSTINLVIPILNNFITHWERYRNPRVEIYVAVFRNYLLKLGMLGVICAFWLGLTSTDVSNEDVCWENELGQEVYRLVIFDFLFSIVFATFCAEFLRKIFSLYCCKEILQKAEFSIVNNVMDLIYGQTLCWIGVFFSPLLAFIVILKYFLLFYVKKISVMQNCQPAKKRWRAAQSSTMFNGFLLVSFLLTAIFLCVVVFRETPSVNCGPFRGLQHAYDVVVLKFDFLLGNYSTEWFAIVMRIITSVWFLSAINTALIVLIVLRRSKAQGLASLGKALREQIVLEGKDKLLLLKWLRELSNDDQPPEGRVPGGSKNHRVPILMQHAASAASTPAHARPASELSYKNSMKEDILTHVDPQHVSMTNLASSSPVVRRRHHDPVVARALASKQRPRTTYDMTSEDGFVDLSSPQRNSYSGPMELRDIDTSPESSSGRSTPSSGIDFANTRYQGNVYMQSNF